MKIMQMHKMTGGALKQAALALAVLAGIQTAAFAATTYTFTNTVAGTYAWTTPGNWAASGVPVSATNATVAFFSEVTTALTGGVTVNTDPATLTLNTLTLKGLAKASTATAVSIGTAGNTWDFDGAAPTLNVSGLANGTGALTYTIIPNITLNQPIIVSGLGTAGLTISGAIGGTGKSLTKASAGTLILSGSNTYTGGTVVVSGVLQFNSLAAIAGSGRNVAVGRGSVAAAGYAIDNTFLNRLAENSNAAVIALGANSDNGLDFSSSTGANLPNAYLGATGNATYSGTLTPGSNGFFLGGGGSATLTVSSLLGGTTKGLTVGGNVTLNGSAVNTFTGGVNITNGGLVGGVAATLITPNTLALDFANRITPTNLFDPANVLTLGGGRLDVKGKSGAVTSQSFASTTLSANTASIVSFNKNSATSVSLSLGTITRNVGSTLFYNIQNSPSPLDGTTVLAPTTYANDASGILAPWAFANNQTYAANNGSGQIIPYTGASVVAATAGSTLAEISNKDVNYSLAGVHGQTYTLGGNITGNTLSLFTAASGANYTIANAGKSITLNGIICAGGGGSRSSTISGAGNLEIGANKELVLNVFRMLNIACPIVDNGTGAASPAQSAVTYTSICTSDGGYALTLSGSAPNTYSGITTVAGGSLSLNKTAGVNAIPGDVFISSGALIWSANNQIADTANLTFLGTAKVSGTPTETVASVTTKGNTGGFAFGGSTAFTVTGALALTGNQGPAAVTASSYGLSGTAAMTVGSLSLDDAYYSVGTASGNAPTLSLNGDFTGANIAELNTASGATPNFVLKGAGTHNHIFNIISGTTTISPPISETASTTASLTKTGAGTLALNAINSYSGATTVSNGILRVNAPAVVGGAVIVASGAMLSGNGTINGSATLLSGGLLSFTQGTTLTIAGSLTLDSNTVHLNLPVDLAEGSYTLATYNTSGSDGTFAANPVIDSGSLVKGASAKILTTGGNVTLKVSKASGLVIILF